MKRLTIGCLIFITSVVIRFICNDNIIMLTISRNLLYIGLVMIIINFKKIKKISSIYKSIYFNNPDVIKYELEELEENDERGIAIRQKVESKTFQILIHCQVLLVFTFCSLRIGTIAIVLSHIPLIITVVLYLYFSQKYKGESLE